MSAPARVVKLMSLTRQEFVAALANVGGVEAAGDGTWFQNLPDGHVTIAFEPRPSARLGGLLDLPRASVTLAFETDGEASRRDFMRRFDIAFQRGGG
jgi:hypothetical protein